MDNAIALRLHRAAFVLLFGLPVGCASAASPAPTTHLASANAGPAPFDRIAAAEALDELQEDASRCGTKGSPTGLGRATVVFEPTSGRAKVTDQEAPFAGNPVSRCIDAVFGAAHVPPFRGSPVTVRVGFLVTPPESPPAFSVRTAKLGVKNAVAQCSLTVRTPRDVADEVDVHFTRTGAVDAVEFFRFEDHQKLDSRATRCIRKALGGARVAAFASDEERANVKLFFSDGT
jgi:hypothetical protein